MTTSVACSGSGKSTLLDIISSRKTTGKITGQVLFGSQKATQPFLRRYAGYVEQADTLLPVLVRSICSPVLVLQPISSLSLPRAVLLQLLSASATANDGDDVLLSQLMQLQCESMLLPKQMLLTDGFSL